MPWINIFDIMLLILNLYVVTLRVWACFRLHMIVTKCVLGPQTAAAARAYVMMPRSDVTIICVLLPVIYPPEMFPRHNLLARHVRNTAIPRLEGRTVASSIDWSSETEQTALEECCGSHH